MQLLEELPPGIQSEVQFAGGMKADGTWGGNSLFNNKPFRKEMNLAYAKGLGQEEKKALRADLKAKYGTVECEDEQMEQARST
jgi:hypothetical protein